MGETVIQNLCTVYWLTFYCYLQIQKRRSIQHNKQITCLGNQAVHIFKGIVQATTLNINYRVNNAYINTYTQAERHRYNYIYIYIYAHIALAITIILNEVKI